MSSILSLKRNRFEAALKGLCNGSPVRDRFEPYDRVLESTGRLKQRFSGVARHREITVEKVSTGPNASAVHFKRRPQQNEVDTRTTRMRTSQARPPWT